MSIDRHASQSAVGVTQRGRAAPLHILLYTWPFPPSIGGLEHLSEMTAEGLTDEGIRVTVVTQTPDDAAESAEHKYGVVRRPGARALARLVRGVDVVYLFTFHTLLVMLAFLFRVPVVWQHIDYDTVCPRGICFAYGRPCIFTFRHCYPCLRRDHSRWRAIRSILALGARKWGAATVTRNVISTQYAQAKLGLTRPAFLTFGVDTAFWSPTGPRPAPPPFTVVFASRHFPAKGCDVLVQAIHRCRERGLHVRARVIGDGPHRVHSQALAEKLGLQDRVTFLGFVTREDVRAEYRLAHALVIPSVQDEIGQMVAFEAMSTGLPVVSSRIGGLPEQIGDAGRFFTTGDPDALAATLADLAGDQSHWLALSDRARERALRECDWDRTVEHIVRLSESVVSAAGARR